MHRIPPATDPLAADLIGAIFPLFKDSQSDVMAATAKFDLTFSQLRMLFVLDKAATDLAINELADRVSLSMAAAGRAVDGLVRSGLLLRRDDAEDRRIKRIALSPTGGQMIEHIVEARRAAAERFVSLLDDAERAELAAAVKTLSVLTRAHFPHLYASFSTCTPDTSP
jgi:DNA-binding MarR family transcriptional regulator